MNLVLVSLAAVAVIFHPVLTQETLPITVLQGDGDTCPSDQLREGAQQNITTAARRVIQSVVRYGCGEGDWRNVASLDMSDPSQQCPSQWREYTDTPIRVCGRPESSTSCHSASYFVASQYTKVCGRVIGYEYGTTDAFTRFTPQTTGTADDNYVDGVSVTHGSSPRSHIWTFAAAWHEPSDGLAHPTTVCPCAAPSDSTFGTPPPSYVGNNYFCETGNPIAHPANDFPVFFYTEPLWDGQGCDNSQCCSFNTPPWFNVQLPSATTDHIEVRICGDQGQHGEDATINLLEIYVQ